MPISSWVLHSVDKIYISWVKELQVSFFIGSGHKSLWRTKLPRERTTWTFDSHVIRSYSLKPRQIYRASRSLKANNFLAFFSSFEFGGIKYEMTGPAGKSNYCLPETSMFPEAKPRGQSLSAYYVKDLSTFIAYLLIFIAYCVLFCIVYRPVLYETGEGKWTVPQYH